MLLAPAVRFYTRDMHVFSSLGAYQQTGYELSGTSAPAQINASRLTASMFQVLGVSPIIGRTFNLQEDEGSQQLAVISYRQMCSTAAPMRSLTFWARLFFWIPRSPTQIIGSDAAGIRVSAGSGSNESQRTLGPHELHPGRVCQRSRKLEL